MKKQILILTFFVAALIFSGTNKSYGQYVNTLSSAPSVCLTPTPLDVDCAGDIDQLHPQPGIEYNYWLPTTNADDKVHWFVVNYSTIETNGDSLINVIADMTGTLPIIEPDGGGSPYILDAEDGVYNVPSQTQDSVKITWKSFDGTIAAGQVILLVSHVYNVDSCTDNIEVYRIVPEFNFTLDITTLADDGTIVDTLANPSECVSPVESAEYVPADDIVGNGVLNVDYGENWVFFMVSAANFTHSWMPEFQTDYSGGVGADGITVEWALASEANLTTGWHTSPEQGATGNSSYTSLDSVPVINANGADDGTGECIVVRVRVDHGIYENDDVAQTLTLAVDGVMYDANAASAAVEYDNTDLADLHYADCTADGFTYDFADFDLTPRPEVEIGDPTPTEPKVGDEN